MLAALASLVDSWVTHRLEAQPTGLQLRPRTRLLIRQDQEGLAQAAFELVAGNAVSDLKIIQSINKYQKTSTATNLKNKKVLHIDL